jgi:hypothetical protein
MYQTLSGSCIQTYLFSNEHFLVIKWSKPSQKSNNGQPISAAVFKWLQQDGSNKMAAKNDLE